MEKAIIVLTGHKEGKNIFVDTIKEHKFWTWNINHLNRLSSLIYSLGWDGERTTEYYEFLKKFEGIANDYFDFKNQYVRDLIGKFLNNEKANILIVHSSDPELTEGLQKEYLNCYSIHISDNDFEKENCSKTLNYKDKDFTEKLLEAIKTLTKDIKEIKGDTHLNV